MNVSLIGAGAFGTALANQLARARNDVKIWAYEVEAVDQINKSHENQMYLPGAKLLDSISASNVQDEVYAFSDVIFLAPPFFALPKLLPKSGEGKTFVCASKGIENETGRLAFQIVEEAVSGSFEVSVLSGASFAAEVAKGLPTKVVVASKNQETAKKVADLIQTVNFKVEISEDVMGVELGGALKNVLAIALGMVKGAGHGKDFEAAVFTQGLSEMIKLGGAMGAKKETFYSIAGLGDYFVTATSDESRNFTFGMKVSSGEEIGKLLSSKNVVEGANTAKTVYGLCKKHNLDLTIFSNVYAVIYEGKDSKTALNDIWRSL